MATNIDELVIQIRADTKQLTKALDKVKKKTKDAGNSGKKDFAGFTKQLGKVKVAALGIVAAMAVVVTAGKKIATVGMAFEDLQISLNTVFGGIEGGKKAFDQVISFAETTPFQIEDVTKAFIRLKSAGLEPNLEMLKTFGDAASIAGNATEAFASLVKIASKATGGGLGLEELEQLETQGIAVYPILRKQLGLTRDKIADFGKSTAGAALIIKALQKGLKETTGGTMAARMENLSTKVSNLQISFKKLGLAIFQGGLGDALKNLTDRLTDFVNVAARAKDIQNKLKAGEELSASDRAFNISQIDRGVESQGMGSGSGAFGDLGALDLEKNAVLSLIPTLSEEEMETLLQEVGGFAKKAKLAVDAGLEQEANPDYFLGLFKSLKTQTLVPEGEANQPFLAAQNEIRSALLARLEVMDGVKDAADDLIDRDKQIADLYAEGKGMNAVADLDKLQDKLAESKNDFLELDELTDKLKIAPTIMVPKLDDNGEAIVDEATGKIEKVRKYSEAVVDELVKFVGEQRKVIQDGLDLKDLNVLKEQYGEIAGSIQGTVTPAQALKKEIDAIALALETDKDAFMQMFPEMTIAEVDAGLVLLRAELKGMQDDAKNTEVSDQYGDIQSAIQGTVSKAQELQGQIAQLDSVIGDENKLAEIFPEMTMQQVEDGLALLRAELVQIGVDAQNANIEKTFGNVKSAVESVISPTIEMKANLDRMRAAFDSSIPWVRAAVFGTMTDEEAQASIDAYIEKMKEIGAPAKEVAETLGGALAQAISSLSHAFTNNFVTALMEGKNALGAFKDFAKSMVSQIISIFLQMAIVNKIINSIFGGQQGFQKLPEWSFGGGDVATDASGGHYNKGTPTLVGERGPELIIPNTSGSVMNGMNTKNAMGGGSTIVVNQSLNFSTGVVGTVRAEIQKMLPTIAEVSKASVLDASRRGGNFRKGLLGA